MSGTKTTRLDTDFSFRVDCNNAYEFRRIINTYGDGWFVAMYSEGLMGSDFKPFFSSLDQIVLARSKEQLTRTLLDWESVGFRCRKTNKFNISWPLSLPPEKIDDSWPLPMPPDMAWHWEKPMDEFGDQWPCGLQDLPNDLTTQEVKEMIFPMVVSEIEDVCLVLEPPHLRLFMERIRGLQVVDVVDVCG